MRETGLPSWASPQDARDVQNSQVGGELTPHVTYYYEEVSKCLYEYVRYVER